MPRYLTAAPQLLTRFGMDISGKWHGEWISVNNGHHGSLNARIWKVSDTRYDARFSGRFFVLVPFTFRASLEVTEQEDGNVCLSSSKHIPIFGDFCLRATATPRTFEATFASKDDQGRFSMHR